MSEEHIKAEHAKSSHNSFIAFTKVPQVEQPLEDLFTKTVTLQIPQSGKEAIVQYSPYIGLILGILLLPAVFAILGLVGLVGTVGAAFGVVYGPLYYLGILITVIQIIMYFMAYPQLVKKSKEGWSLLFYAELLSIAASIFSGGLVGAIIGGAIGFFILYQIKYFYK